jgi:hypothetical protein
MEARAVKGSVILASVDYADTLCDRLGCPRVREKFSPELTAALVTMTRTTWHPWAILVEVLRAIASVRHDPVASREDLIACGQAISQDGLNTFLRLLLKIMTLRLFVMKFKDFWSRDVRGAVMTVDSSAFEQRRVTCTLEHVDGFDHLGPTGIGFIGLAMEKIAGCPVAIVVSPWSLEQPGPATLRWDISW